VIPVANYGGESVEDLPFLRGGPNDVRGGEAFGQLEIDVRARVANHHVA
jgi:hypothetical protein